MRRFFLTILLTCGLTPLEGGAAAVIAANAAAKAAKVAPAKTVTVKKGDTLYSLARKSGLSVEQLRQFNGLKDNTISVGQVLKLGGPAQVSATPTPQPAPKVPTSKVPTPKAVPAQAPTKPVATKPAPKPAALPNTYTVRAGDTLGKISKIVGLSTEQLRRINGLSSDTLQVGQVLKLKGSPAPAAKPAKPTSQGVYTVRAGDTLGEISSRYGVSVLALQNTNRIDGTVILVGQKLQIPPRGTGAGAKIPSLPPGKEARTIYTYVRVGKGETPSSFSATYNTTPDVIRRLNGLSTLNQIVPGAKLLVPSRMAVPVPPRALYSATSLRSVTVDGIPVQVVQVDLRWRNVLVAPVLPSRGLTFGSGATVSALTQLSGASALVNGSYFHPQTYAPAGDIVMQGRLLTWGRIPAALAITPDNRASITGSTTAVFGRPLDSTWNGMETVIATGPRIVKGGVVMNTFSGVFQDPAVFGQAARSAIGLISNRDLLMVSTHAKLSVTEMGRVMALLGARDALLLDGGSSAGISFNGKAVLNSVRKVSYGIGVFTNYTGRRYAR